MQTIFRSAVFLVLLSASFLSASCKSDDNSNAVSEDAAIEGIYWNTYGGGDLHFVIVKNGQDYEINVTQYYYEMLEKTIILDSSTEDVFNLVDDIFNEKHDIKNDTFTPSGLTGSWTSITLIYSNDTYMTVENINSSILNTIYEFVEDNLY